MERSGVIMDRSGLKMERSVFEIEPSRSETEPSNSGMEPSSSEASTYLKADGELLGIEGAQIAPPDPGIVPDMKVTLATGGFPQLEVPKGQFDGFDFWMAIGSAPEQLGGFSTMRRYIQQVTLPPAGQAVIYTYRAQYRYRGASFGQKSLPVPITLRS